MASLDAACRVADAATEKKFKIGKAVTPLREAVDSALALETKKTTKMPAKCVFTYDRDVPIKEVVLGDLQGGESWQHRLQEHKKFKVTLVGVPGEPVSSWAEVYCEKKDAPETQKQIQELSQKKEALLAESVLQRDTKLSPLRKEKDNLERLLASVETDATAIDQYRANLQEMTSDERGLEETITSLTQEVTYLRGEIDTHLTAQYQTLCYFLEHVNLGLDQDASVGTFRREFDAAKAL
jgi:hypothetical protein